jgi:hypothetical protein
MNEVFKIPDMRILSRQFRFEADRVGVALFREAFGFFPRCDGVRQTVALL